MSVSEVVWSYLSLSIIHLFLYIFVLRLAEWMLFSIWIVRNTTAHRGYFTEVNKQTGLMIT